VFKFSVPKPIVLFLVLLTCSTVLFFIIYFIIAEEKRFRKLDKKHKEIESIRNIIRILILEAVIPLYLLFISFIYGKGPKVWMLIGLLSIAIISISTAIGLWKFRKKHWVRLVAEVLSIIILLPVTILFQVTWKWILLGVYFLSVAFVIICIIIGLTTWTISCIKEVREKRGKR
jgi:cation transport ATPase